MAVHNLEVSTENLLSAVVRMPDNEFDRFVEKARKLRRSTIESRWTKREVEQIKKLNESVLTPEKQSRFDTLVKKRRIGKINERELEELIELNRESEALNVRRMELAAKLATAKNKPLPEIMNELELPLPKII